MVVPSLKEGWRAAPGWSPRFLAQIPSGGTPLKSPLVQGGTVFIECSHAPRFLRRNPFIAIWHCKGDELGVLRIFRDDLDVGFNPVGRPSAEVASSTACARQA